MAWLLARRPLARRLPLPAPTLALRLLALRPLARRLPLPAPTLALRRRRRRRLPDSKTKHDTSEERRVWQGCGMACIYT